MRAKHVFLTVIGCLLAVLVSVQPAFAYEYAGAQWCCQSTYFGTYHVAPTNYCGTYSPDWHRPLIVSAAAEWSALGSGFELIEYLSSMTACTPSTTYPNAGFPLNVCVGFKDGENNVAVASNCDYWTNNNIIAIATWWYSISTDPDDTCCIFECDICFNDNVTWFTNSGACSGNCYDFLTVATHEFGHWIASGHEQHDDTLGYKPVMYPYFDYCEQRRAITPDDSDLVGYAYGLPGMALPVMDTKLGYPYRCQTVHRHPGTTWFSNLAFVFGRFCPLVLPPWSNEMVHGYPPGWPKQDSTIVAGEDVQFVMGLTHITDDPILTFFNGFRVYSPDGATWQPITLDTGGLGWHEMFDVGPSVVYFSANGSGADTVGIWASAGTRDGIPGNSCGPIWWIETSVSADDVGKHICFDTSFWPPAGIWRWITGSGTVIPEWDGPHCFEIVSCCVYRGDLDHSNGDAPIDIADLVYLVDYMFNEGPEPVCLDEGNVDGIEPIDISDLVYLVDYMFIGGPAPPPCP